MLLHEQQRMIQPLTLDSAVRRNSPAKTHLISKLVSFQLRNEDSPIRAICRLFVFGQISLDGHWWTSTSQPKHRHAGCQLSVWGRDPRICGTFQLPVWVIQGVAEIYSRKMSQIQVQTASRCWKPQAPFFWPFWSEFAWGFMYVPNKTLRQTKDFLLRALNRGAAEGKELLGHPPLGCDKGC